MLCSDSVFIGMQRDITHVTAHPVTYGVLLCGMLTSHLITSVMNSQTTEITDPLKVFDSFSVFVEPIIYQIIFHLVSVLYITPHLVKY